MYDKRVLFESPKLLELNSLGYNCVDMHTHSRFSDTTTRLHFIQKKMQKYSFGIALTDHNEIQGSIELARRVKDQLVVPGMEVTVKEGPHMLLYFYNVSEMQEFYSRNIKPFKSANPHMLINKSVIDLIDVAQNYNCLISAAHPYGYGFTNMGLSKCIKKKYFDEGILDKIHAMEVISGGMNRILNKKSYVTAFQKNMAITAGSDAHTLYEIGTAVTCSYSQDLSGFLDSIKKHENILIGTEATIVPRLDHASRVLSQHIKHPVGTFQLQFDTYRKRLKRKALKLKEPIAEIKRKIRIAGLRLKKGSLKMQQNGQENQNP